MFQKRKVPSPSNANEEEPSIPTALLNEPLSLHIKLLTGDMILLTAAANWSLEQVKDAALELMQEESSDPLTNLSRARGRLLSFVVVAMGDESRDEGALTQHTWVQSVRRHLTSRSDATDPLMLMAIFKSPPPSVLQGTPCRIYHRKADDVNFRAPPLIDGKIEVCVPAGYNLYFTSCRMMARTSEFQPVIQHLGRVVEQQLTLPERSFRKLAVTCCEGPVRVEESVLISLVSAVSPLSLQCINLVDLVVSYTDRVTDALLHMPVDQLTTVYLPRPLLDYDVDGVVEWNDTHLTCMRNYHKVMMHFFRALTKDEPPVSVTTSTQVDFNTLGFRNIAQEITRVCLVGHQLFAADQVDFLPFTFFTLDQWRNMDRDEEERVARDVQSGHLSSPRMYGPRVLFHTCRGQTRDAGCNFRV